MPTNTIAGDLVVTGKIVAGSQIVAGDQAAIPPLAMDHQHRAGFQQPNTAATSETRVIHTCMGTTGVVRRFSAGSIAVAVGAATVTVDLRKNGVSILTAPITLDTGNSARVPEAGTLASASAAALVAGDVLEVVTVATAGGGTLPTGVFAEARIDEDYAG